MDDKPIDMVLHCPKCFTQHIDEPGFTNTGVPPGSRYAHLPATASGTFLQPWLNPPHKSHLCHHCGCIWRPADIPTNGVAAVRTRGKADNWPEKTCPVEGTHCRHGCTGEQCNERGKRNLHTLLNQGE